MDIHYLKAYESDFVQFLLNGASDDKLDIGPTCIAFLEEHGLRMKEAMKALGEEEEIKTLQEQHEADSKKPEQRRNTSEANSMPDADIKESQDDAMEQID